MKDLSPVARTLLESARDAGAPSAAAKARVEQALAVRLASPLGAGAVAGAGKAALGASMTMKGLVVAGLAGVVTLAGLELATEGPTASKSQTSVASHEAKQDVANSGHPPAPPVVQAAATADALPIEPPREAAQGADLDERARQAESSRWSRSDVAADPMGGVPQTSAPEGERRGAQRASSPARLADFGASASEHMAELEQTAVERERAAMRPYETEPFSQDTKRRNRPAAKTELLAAETQGLRAIQRALREGNGQLALELISADGTQYAKGVLHQERAAARIQALCLLGRTDAAQTEAATFEEKWPRSPLLARVRSACR